VPRELRAPTRTTANAACARWRPPPRGVLRVLRGTLRWEKGEPAYYHSSKIARRGFCRGCGTPLTFGYLDSDQAHLAIGGLDEFGRFYPVAHYGSESIVASFFPTTGTRASAWRTARGSWRNGARRTARA
jgi:hypothetical protein